MSLDISFDRKISAKGNSPTNQHYFPYKHLQSNLKYLSVFMMNVKPWLAWIEFGFEESTLVHSYPRRHWT